MKNILLFYLSLIATWLAPIYGLLVLVGAFILADTVMGIYSSYINGKPILSRKLQRALVKSVLYSSTFLLFYGIDTLIINDALLEFVRVPLFLSKSVCVFLISIELFSIDEKIRSINKGKGFKFYFDRLLGELKIYRKKISDITENKDN